MRWPASVLLLTLPLLCLADLERTVMPGPDRFSLRALLPVSRQQLLPLLERPCHVRQWMPGLDRLRLLSHPSPGQSLVYMSQPAPWPLLGRDAVTLFERRDGEPVMILMTGQPDAYPLQPGYVRMPVIEGRWSLWARGDTTLVEYQQRVDPGGNLPQWLADRLAPARMRAALEALDNYARDPNPAACDAGGPDATGPG